METHQTVSETPPIYMLALNGLAPILLSNLREHKSHQAPHKTKKSKEINGTQLTTIILFSTNN